ncbi:MAG: arsenosugar biosynthesis radical SAM (seleno)protein ArsS [Opitutales bacterium]
MTLFRQVIDSHGMDLKRGRPRVLQLNVGKLCNLTCIHCHVNAGPKRKEIMTRETVDRVLAWQRAARLPVVDLTGGAPEMIPDFRYLIEKLREADPDWQIIDRCNLTILLEPGYEGLAEFLKKNRVEIVASMPCYSPQNVNEQRGEGVFDASIAALQLLNRLGYGQKEELPLHLVYNPNGPFLPGPQEELEADYKRELEKHFGVVFNDLYCITNLPVSRFASWLKRNGHYESYLQTLVEAFNPSTVDDLMCRDTVNVSWKGEVFDCDFNQMANLHIGEHGRPTYLWDIDPGRLEGRQIRTAAHCFGCTAGAGSSCGGSLEEKAAALR